MKNDSGLSYKVVTCITTEKFDGGNIFVAFEKVGSLIRLTEGEVRTSKLNIILLIYTYFSVNHLKECLKHEEIENK